MSKRLIKKGSTDQTLDIFVQDSSSAVGAGLTGLVFNSAGLTCYYRRGATGTPTALTLATLSTIGTAHADGGFKEADATNMPGMYRLDLSDAIVATGAPYVVLMLKGATNMAPVTIELQLVDFDPEDAADLGLTALTGHTPQTGDAFARLGAPAGASVSADIAAIEAQTDDIGAAGAGLTALATQASVNAIDDFLDTEVAAILALLDDPRGEPGQGAPPVNPDLATKIDYLYKAWRNKKTQTGTTLSIFNDAGTVVDQKATVSDDGTTFESAELVSGP